MTEFERPGLLEVLEPLHLRELMTHSRTVRVRKGQTLFGRGELSKDVFLVQEGRLQAVLYAADGREVSLRELSGGQLFGELSAIDDAARSVSIMGVTDARMLAFTPESFRAALAASPAASDWLLRRLTAQVRSLTDRVFELNALNVQARLHCELVRLAKSLTNGALDPAPTHAELANRIGTHREAVTRELNALEERGLIRSGRRRIEFTDLDRLEREIRSKLRTPVGGEGWW